jgi:hypothetical protein
MHFGDGTHKEILSLASSPEDACDEIRTYVLDNAWFEVIDEEGNTLAERKL